MTWPTVGAFLFSAATDPEEALSSRLQAGRILQAAGIVDALAGFLGDVSDLAQDAVCRRIAAAAHDLADLDLVAVAVDGWRKHTALVEAAQRTLEHPGSEELVELASHQLVSVHRASIDIVLVAHPGVAGELRLGTVALELHLNATVHGLIATVSEGRLAAVQGGRCELSVRFSCEGIELASREDEIDALVFVDLTEPAPLLPAAAHPVGIGAGSDERTRDLTTNTRLGSRTSHPDGAQRTERLEGRITDLEQQLREAGEVGE